MPHHIHQDQAKTRTRDRKPNEDEDNTLTTAAQLHAIDEWRHTQIATLGRIGNTSGVRNKVSRWKGNNRKEKGTSKEGGSRVDSSARLLIDIEKLYSATIFDSFYL